MLDPTLQQLLESLVAPFLGEVSSGDLMEPYFSGWFQETGLSSSGCTTRRSCFKTSAGTPTILGSHDVGVGSLVEGMFCGALMVEQPEL